MDFKELSSWLIKRQQNLELFSVTAWTIWTHQNRVRMHQPCCNPNQLATIAKELLSKFLAVQPLPQLQSTLTHARWRAPVLDMAKVNFDGAIFNKEQKSGINVVIRDAQGAVLASLSRILPQIHNPFEVEAIVAASALQLASDLGFLKVVLEGVC